MIALFQKVLSRLYLKVRGNTTTLSEPTGSNYTYTHVYHSQESGERIGVIRLRSYQFSHLIRYANWFIPNRMLFTYEVRVIMEPEGGEIKTLPAFHFPQLCAKWLSRTKYPHICAINASLDKIVSMHLEPAKGV